MKIAEFTSRQLPVDSLEDCEILVAKDGASRKLPGSIITALVGGIFPVDSYKTGSMTDLQALNAAIDAASAAGGLVILGSRTYSITATVTVPAGVTLQGCGRGSTTLSLSGDAGVEEKLARPALQRQSQGRQPEYSTRWVS